MSLLRVTTIAGLIVLPLNMGCASLLSTAVTLPFEVGRQAQDIAFAQIDGTFKVAKGAISLIDHVSEVSHRHAMRKAERERRYGKKS